MQLALSLSMCSSSGGMAGVNAQLAALLSSALIPGRDGVLTVTSDATVDPITGAAVPANTANGRTLNVGGYSFPGAALLAQRASTTITGGGTLTGTQIGLLSNTTAAGDYPTVRTFVEDTSAATHQALLPLGVTLTPATNYVASVLVKRGTGTRHFALAITDLITNNFTARFNLDTGVVTTGAVGGGSVVGSGVISRGNGWYILYVAGASSAWAANGSLVGGLATAAATSYTGDGSSSMQIVGYKVEPGTYPTSIHSLDGGGAVSRQANLLSWNQALSLTAGTVFGVYIPYGSGGTLTGSSPRLYGCADGSLLAQTAGAKTFLARRVDTLAANNGVTSGLQTVAAGQQSIVTQRFDAVSNRITNGGVTVSSAAPTLPFVAATPIIIGNIAALGAHLDGWVGILLFPTALSDSDVALLTSYSSIV